MFDSFEALDIETSGATIHLRHGGNGPPLLLLHGNPMTHVTWHKIAEQLAREYHVVATDLRGYGDSSAPEPGENHVNYSFRAMAQDQIEVMQALGFKRFMVAGHDRGARTAHRMALDHPDCVIKVALIDILPNHHIWTNGTREWAMRSWHWTFMSQPADLPERMMASVPAHWFIERKLSKPGIGIDFIDKEAFSEYVRCFNEKTIRGSCEDYRACATCDSELDSSDYQMDNKVKIPLLIIWGSKSHTGVVWGNVLEIWKNYALEVTGGSIECGHYVQEEAPVATLKWLVEFFDNA